NSEVKCRDITDVSNVKDVARDVPTLADQLSAGEGASGSLSKPEPPIPTIAASAAQASENPYAPDAPTISVSRPPAHAPIATPNPIEVEIHAMPSVSSDGGTRRSVSEKPVMSVGEMASPATNSHAAITRTSPMRTIGVSPTTKTPSVRTNRPRSEIRQRRDPNHSPDTIEPPANAASRNPETPFTPRSSANATVIKSTEPNTAPRHR